MKPGVTVVIPTIAGREPLLKQAIASVHAQVGVSRPALVVVEDRTHAGAAATRDRALRLVQTEWTAFLDSDDVLYANHLAVLALGPAVHGADYAYSWFHVIDQFGRRVSGADPLGHFGRPFDPEHPTQTTITTLVRTELAQEVGFHDVAEPGSVDGQAAGEDYRFTLGCVAAGARIVHIPQRTWGWRHHGVGRPGRVGNTSGRGDRW